MKIQYVVMLVMTKCVFGSKTEEAMGPSLHGKSPLSDSEYKVDNDFFPDVDYPTSVLDSMPFYYKASDVLLDPFDDDVKSTFKSIATEINTKSNNTSQQTLLEYSKLMMKDMSEEANKKELSANNDNDAVINQNEMKNFNTDDIIITETSSQNNDLDETRTGLDKSVILENSSSSEESQERDNFETNIKSSHQYSIDNVHQHLAHTTINKTLSSDKISDIDKSTREQYENQIPVPIFLGETEKSDLEEMVLDMVDKIPSFNTTVENSDPVFGDLSSIAGTATQAISTAEFIMTKPPLASIIENLDGIINA